MDETKTPEREIVFEISPGVELVVASPETRRLDGMLERPPRMRIHIHERQRNRDRVEEIPFPVLSVLNPQVYDVSCSVLRTLRGGR